MYIGLEVADIEYRQQQLELEQAFATTFVAECLPAIFVVEPRLDLDHVLICGQSCRSYGKSLILYSKASERWRES